MSGKIFLSHRKNKINNIESAQEIVNYIFKSICNSLSYENTI